MIIIKSVSHDRTFVNCHGGQSGFSAFIHRIKVYKKTHPSYSNSTNLSSMLNRVSFKKLFYCTTTMKWTNKMIAKTSNGFNCSAFFYSFKPSINLKNEPFKQKVDFWPNNWFKVNHNWLMLPIMTHLDS